MKTALTLVSGNAKIGPIPVSITSNVSCPPSCPLNHANNGGCYAEYGPLAIHWKKISTGERGDDYDTFIEKIKNLPAGQFFRHNAAGDLYGNGENIEVNKLVELVLANTGKKGFTYTHKYNTEKNMKAIKFANENGFTVNISANSIEHANEMVGKGAPVVTILPLEYQRKYKQGGEWLETEAEYKQRISSLPQRLEKGNKVTVCPATYKDNVTCNSCRLCQKANRSTVVGFPVHGAKKKTAEKIMTGM